MHRNAMPFGVIHAVEWNGGIQLEAVCPRLGGIHRAYLVGDSGFLPVGVMEPDGVSMRAQKRYTRCTLREQGIAPDALTHGVLLEGDEKPVIHAVSPDWSACVDPWTLVSDPVLQQTLLDVTGVYVRHAPQGTELAVPAGELDRVATTLCSAVPDILPGYFVIRLLPDGSVWTPSTAQTAAQSDPDDWSDTDCQTTPPAP